MEQHLKPGELILTEQQKQGLKKAEEVRAALVKAVQEDYSKRPYPKRKGK
jgi:hypothetical protein